MSDLPGALHPRLSDEAAKVVLVEIYANPIVAQKEIVLALNPNNLAGTAYLPFADDSNTLNFNTWNTTHDYAPNGYSAEVT